MRKVRGLSFLITIGSPVWTPEISFSGGYFQVAFLWVAVGIFPVDVCAVINNLTDQVLLQDARIKEANKEIEELMKVDYWQDRHDTVKKELDELKAKIL